MKKTMFAGLVVLTLAAGTVSAQQHKDSSTFKQDMKETATGVKKGAKKVGNKTAEIAVKGTSAVKDQVYKDKVGPGGETIYIDNNSRYYYVNSKGGKVYVPKASLKDK